ncbi:hypothetical protein Goklo_029025 [Gossypium klotzschianum]|uniref:RNase H type-1 domain-containing protein n=1 Tax=Gossypium klotzschianum TaxID=34286 RepID=A0A7J8W3Z6_9ROSI|nr:hypothetical protein [Gossypium klotzschianum]
MENKPQLAQEIKLRIHSFLKEFDELGKRLHAKLSPFTGKWSPPTDPYVKVNVGAAFKEHRRQSRSGFVIRDMDGQPLQFALNMGFIMVEVEGDFRVVISRIIQGKDDKSQMSAYISDVRSLAKSFLRAIFRHASRDCSRLAHEIAQVGFRMDESTYWVEEVPCVAAAAVTTDRWWVDPPD